MREFDIDLTDYITKGITPNKQHITQVPGLYECKELMVAKDGLRARPAIFELDSAYGGFDDYPLPEIFDNVDEMIITNETGVYVYDTAQKLFNTAAAEIVDFIKFIVINPESALLEYTISDTGVFSNITPTTPSYPNFTSVCNYNNAQAFGVLGKWLYWSRINEFNFTIDDAKIAGNLPLPYKGDGLRVLQLGNHIICYGDSGVVALTPVQQPMGAWRQTNIKQLKGIGLKSFNAVCDTGDNHLFIGNDDNLWKLSSDLKLEKLGYDYLLKGIEEPICEFVAMFDCVYISSANVCYLYTPQGLTRVQHYSRSNVPYYSDEYKIAGYPNVATGYDKFEVTTLPIDFKMRAVKHIQAIEADIKATGVVECSIDWRLSTSDAFRSTDWVRLNPAGVVQIPCSGVDFRIKFRGTVDSEFYLASLMAKIKYENKSTLRGRYAR